MKEFGTMADKCHDAAEVSSKILDKSDDLDKATINALAAVRGLLYNLEKNLDKAAEKPKSLDKNVIKTIDKAIKDLAKT